MKLHFFYLLLFGSWLTAQELAPTKMDHRIVIEAPEPKAKDRLFYQSAIESVAGISAERVVETAVLDFQIMQGEAERVTVELFGGAPVLAVVGDELASWAVRRDGARRFLDLTPREVTVKEFSVAAMFSREGFAMPSELALTTFGPGEGSGFSAIYTIASAVEVECEFLEAQGVVKLADEGDLERLSANRAASVTLALRYAGAQPEPVELREMRLVGEISEDEKSASFRLLGTAHVASTEPVSLTVLNGRAAPLEAVAAADYRLKLSSEGYQLEFQKAGVYPVEVAFVTPIVTVGDWRKMSFMVPGGAVVPITLTGIPASASFDPGMPVNPSKTAQGHGAFLPATGACGLAWQPERKAEEGELFFTSEAMDEISVGAGLLRQMTSLTIKTLQGELPQLAIQLAGAGEILAVEGDDVLSWKVSEERVLEVILSKPVRQEASFVIRSQSAVEAPPVKTEPLRLTLQGAVRHSGYFRMYHRGAVRIEVTNPVGLTQLSPDQYPDVAALPETVRQVFHYRYPAANRSFGVAVERVKPEVNLTQTLSYDLTETDRVLRADLELEIREAAIREWEFFGPADYSVVSVTGADVADYVVSEIENGQRRLKVIFGKEVAGRRLVKVHFEKNEAAKAGAWILPTLSYPGSTVVGGELGVSAAPGYRVTPGKVVGLAEMPLARLLKRGENLQQAFRVRAEAWSAEMTVAALSQNVQADTYHFYSLQEGRAYVSVLLNYFVTGAPVSEWRLTLPEGIEHLDVDGRDIRDYRVVENELTVPLHRPVMGAYQLLVTYEQAAETSLALGGLAAVGVQAERGFIEVVSPGQVRLPAVQASESLQVLDALELPTEYQLMSQAPTLQAWQYQRRPFELVAEVSWFQRGETAKQVVEFAEVTSRLARDGGIVTTSSFDVRTRDGQELKLEVPEGLEIRDVSVDGEQVTLRKAGELFLVPLPATVSPNLPVRVVVNSSRSGGGVLKEVRLLTPAIHDTTQLMTKWEVRPDTGFELAPVKAAGVGLVTEAVRETGFAWIENQALISFAILLLAWGAGWALMRVPAGIAMVGAAVLLFAAAGAFYLGAMGLGQEAAPQEVLEYQAAVKAPEAALSVTVSHFEKGTMRMADLGVGGVLLGIVLGIAAWQMPARRTWLTVLAGVAFTLGTLSQAGGAGLFFVGLGLVILVIWGAGMRGALAAWRSSFEDDDEVEELENPPSTTGVVSAIFAAFFLSIGGSPLEAVEVKTGDALSEVWEISGERLTAQATMTMTVTGKVGDRFRLLRSPATLTEFAGAGLKVVTEEGDYFLITTEEGSREAKFTYQMPVTEVSQGVPVLTGLAAVRSLKVTFEKAGWAIASSSAVRQQVLPGEGSAAQLWLEPHPGARVTLSPKARDIAAEVTRFYAEGDDLFIPGPGVVDGRHRVKIRPAQGLVRALELLVPEGFTVSEVRSPLVGPWRFDPVKRLLRVELKPAQSKPFHLDIETQRALAELPTEVAVSPMRVQAAAGEVGMLALAFGKEAQLDRDEPQGMTPVNLADFNGGMVPRDRDGQAAAVLQKVYRYADGAASLLVKVAAVSPEVRVESKERLSFGEERTVLASDLTVAITRAGVFRLSFPLPPGFEVESLTGSSLSHWVELEEKGQRLVVLNLKGKTMGVPEFALVLTGTTPALPAKTWAVPKVSLLEASRQSGQLVIVPGRGIQLSVASRKDLSALDPRSVGGTQAGALAYRLLQKSWQLSLAVDQLSPSVAAQMLHDVELREGRSKSRIDALLQVDHASIREIAVTLPPLSEIDAQTVRVSGGEVRDIVNIAENRWQVRFKRRVVGAVPFRIEYEQSVASAVVQAAVIADTRQQETFLALRPGARLRLEPVKAEDWDLVDWSVLPKALFQLDRSGAPAAFLRTTQAEAGSGVAVNLSRHAVVAGAKVKVKSGSLRTVMSAGGELMNQAELVLETLQRGSLVLTLPAQSRLFGVFVNAESAIVVEDGESYRFHVLGDAGGNEARVTFTYATSLGGLDPRDLSLTAFKIGEPLQDVTWTISLPEGYALRDSAGDLDLDEESHLGGANRGDYQSLVLSRNRAKDALAIERLNKASGFFKAGDQMLGNRALVQAYNQGNLDEASNEDVRVKMENVARQNAIIGLNTRRQRLYSDNGGVALEVGQGSNDQIEAAMRSNPVFTGSLKVGREDYQNIINGNNAEVNRMLETIASKWVRNLRITEPTGQMLDPVIPAAGQSVRFTRKIQVDGGEALALQLDLKPQKSEGSPLRFFILCALIAAGLAFVCLASRATKS